MKLRLEDDDLVACVSCGLCLPHCPTYRATGEELKSPRGRIAAMRVVHFGGEEPDDAFRLAIDTCVQCMGCVTACPSGVPYDRLIEGTRAALGSERGAVSRWKRLALRALGHHRLLLAATKPLAIAQRLHLVPRAIAGSLPRIPLFQPPLRASGDDVWLFTGCVMDAWMRATHAAVLRVLERAGAGVALPNRGAACCGALSLHAGLADHASSLAERTMRAFPGEASILVDSAGCGAALKRYGHLLGTEEARRFSARVLDVHEWLAPRIDRLPAERRARRSVAVQDPCHLRHVQRAHQHVRTVLAPFAEVRELDDDGLCCGAGGAYATEQPDLAGAIRERKVASIRRSGARVVVSANPGCTIHLRAAGIDVRHPLEIVDEVIGGVDDGR